MKDVRSPMSKRGYPFVLSEWPLHPTITVELASEWYCIFVLKPTGEDGGLDVFELHFGHLEAYAQHLASSYAVDHCPNPKAVMAFAEAKGYNVDEFAYELIVGRWVIEVREEY